MHIKVKIMRIDHSYGRSNQIKNEYVWMQSFLMI